MVDSAYDWLCERRRNYSHNDEVWDIRFRWTEFKPHLQKTLLRGEYTFSSQWIIKTPGRRTELWSAMDVLVLKAMSIVNSQLVQVGAVRSMWVGKDKSERKHKSTAISIYL